MDKKYQVFISSTFKDLENERKKVQEAILDMGCIPVGMETFPAGDVEQFEYIKKILDISDYIVIISGNRYGSVDNDGVGYTEKEYLYAKDKSIPTIAFLVKNFTGGEKGKKRKLKNFRKELEKNRIVKYWENSEQLKNQVILGLKNIFEENERPGWIRGGAGDKYKQPRVFWGDKEPENAEVGDIWIE